jgi:hypothetical protein
MGALAVMTEPLAPGAYVTPSIRLSRKLGEGGMGSVWVAFHLGLRTEVVVKFISDDKVDSEEALARFEREAALAALAKSPHVVQLFDYGISQVGLPYITMELLEGEDLGSRIAREGAIAPPVLAGWLTQICRGLHRAHAKGIVHRDIKPENIFLCNNDGDTLVKVLDFGIAKGIPGLGDSAGTLTSALLGTPCYMSPEQTSGARNIDYRSDLWALGVLVYYALTCARPFEQTSLAGLVASITTLPIAPPSTHNPALSPAIDAWMATALQREPSARFASAKELAESFASAVHGAALMPGVPGLGTGNGTTKTAGDWARVATPVVRRPAAVRPAARRVWVAGAVLVMIASGVALSLMQRSGAMASPPTSTVLQEPAVVSPRDAVPPPTLVSAAAPTLETVSPLPTAPWAPPTIASGAPAQHPSNTGAAPLQRSSTPRQPGASASSPTKSVTPPSIPATMPGAASPPAPAPAASAAAPPPAVASASGPPVFLDPMHMPLQ